MGRIAGWRVGLEIDCSVGSGYFGGRCSEIYIGCHPVEKSCPTAVNWDIFIDHKYDTLRLAAWCVDCGHVGKI